MRIPKLLLPAVFALGVSSPAWAQASGVTGALLVRDADDRLLGRVVGVPDPERVTVPVSVGGEIVFLEVARNALFSTARVYFTFSGSDCGGTPYFAAPECEEAVVPPSGYDAVEGTLYTASNTIATNQSIDSFLDEAGTCTPTPRFQLPRGCEAVKHEGALAAFTPPFAATPSTGIFCNGFESGDTSCWNLAP